MTALRVMAVLMLGLLALIIARAMFRPRRPVNWVCANCHQSLRDAYRGPFNGNDYVLYCSGCARSVEVSPYDARLRDLLTADGQLVHADVEQSLRPCSSCGGRFGFDELPKCPACSAAVDVTPGRSGAVISCDNVRDDVWLPQTEAPLKPRSTPIGGSDPSHHSPSAGYG